MCRMYARLLVCVLFLLTPVWSYAEGPDSGTSGSQGEGDVEMVPFHKLLGKGLDDLPGCREGWGFFRDDYDKRVAKCDDFHGPSRFDGFPVFLRSVNHEDGKVDIVQALWRSPKGHDHLMSEMESMVFFFTDVCTQIRQKPPIRWKCDRHDKKYRVELGFLDEGTMELKYYKKGVIETLNKKAVHEDNQGL